MPKILLIKTSSMGDVIHNLPVVSDIRTHLPGAEIDWIAEQEFAAVPALHPGVRRVIPVALRRWRTAWFDSANRKEITNFRRQLKSEKYDIVLDTQGLVKSAIIAYLAEGTRCGFDRESAREPLASLFYQRTFPVAKNLHAVERNRQFAAQALGYSLTSPMDYGIAGAFPPHPFDKLRAGSNPIPQQAYAVLLHATSRESKLWPEPDWAALGQHFDRAGLACVLPWGNPMEKERSQRLASQIANSIIPTLLDLNQAAALLARAKLVVGVDTGLAHLAAALNVPVIGIYCGSDPGLTGILATGKGVNLGRAGVPPSAGEVIAALADLMR